MLNKYDCQKISVYSLLYGIAKQKSYPFLILLKDIY